jgi:hypothetical protein
MQPAEFRALNPNKFADYGCAPTDAVTVMAAKEDACSRGCVLLVRASAWASCECRPKEETLRDAAPPEYTPMMAFDSRWASPEPTFDALNINGDRLLCYQQATRGVSPQPTMANWAITNGGFNYGERARFPVPTMHVSKASSVGDKVYNLSERARFPTPTLANGGAAACGEQTYNHSERARFPLPTTAAAQAPTVDEKAYNHGERARFPVPAMATAKASECAERTFNHGERSKFPVPTFAQPALTAE